MEGIRTEQRSVLTPSNGIEPDPGFAGFAPFLALTDRHRETQDWLIGGRKNRPRCLSRCESPGSKGVCWRGTGRPFMPLGPWIGIARYSHPCSRCFTLPSSFVTNEPSMADSTTPRFGFVAFAETWNGRLAMLGFVIGLATEVLTGQGILGQIGLG